MRVSGLRNGGDEASKALMQQQLKQLQGQLSRLDAMIAEATTANDLGRFQTWKRQLIRTLRKEGIKVPKTPTQNKCEHKRWLLTGKIETCRNCGFKRPQSGSQEFKVTADNRKKVIAYIKAQPEGKRGPWPEFAKAVGVSGTNLGAVVRDLLKSGTISEPDGKGSMIYVVVPVKGRAAAKKLYTQQRKADDSPKADVVPASKLVEKRAARTRRATKAA